MKKRFLVLIDFSDYSANLLKYACDWAIHAGAELHLVHQTSPEIPALSDAESRKRIIRHENEHALEQLKEMAQELVLATVPVSFTATERNLSSLLPELLQQPYEQLVFAGLKGTGLMKKIFLGSTTLQLIEHTSNTVVAMPGEISRFTQEKIFIAVSDKHPLNILQLNNFLEFIHKEHLELTFFYHSKPFEETKEMEKQLHDLCKLFAERYKTTFAIYVGTDPSGDIKQVINNKTDELLVIQKGSRMFTDQLFRKFVVNDLVYEGQTPLVILP